MEEKIETSKNEESMWLYNNLIIYCLYCFNLALNENNKPKKAKLKNLDNIDFNKNSKHIRIQSPRSKMALEQLGLEENRLYKMSKKDYL